MKKIKKIWRPFELLDDEIYFLTVIVSLFVSVIVFITDILEGLSLAAQAAVAAIFVLMLVLLYLGLHFPAKRKQLRLCLILIMNFILYPLSFIFSGGIHSGMILFFLVGLFFVPVMLHGRMSVIIFVLSLLFDIVMVELAQHFPQLVVPMSLKQHYQDVKVTLLISGFGLYIITVLILGAYEQERRRNEELMDSLHNLSVKDALSGLYNRRELYRRLEVMYGGGEAVKREDTLVRTNHYIAMFDIDHFKVINDTYGHGVGDQVLRDVAGVLQSLVEGKNGEIASRYGGEEFVCVLQAESMEEAVRRVEEARQNVEALTWEEDPGLHVTISGGILSCMEDADLTKTMTQVDRLLYQAKAEGRNRICR